MNTSTGGQPGTNDWGENHLWLVEGNYVEWVSGLKEPVNLGGDSWESPTIVVSAKRETTSVAGGCQSVEVNGGSFGTYRGAIDLTGPLTDDERLLYRFNAAYQHKDGYRGLENEIVEILPTVTWKPNDFNTLTFDFDYRHVDLVADTYGIPFIGFELLNVARDSRYYTPFANTEQDIYRGAISHQWEINPNLTLRNNFVVLYRDLFIGRNASTGLIGGPNNNQPINRVFREQTDNALDLTY